MSLSKEKTDPHMNFYCAKMQASDENKLGSDDLVVKVLRLRSECQYH